MSSYEYITVFLSVIVGLAVVQLLGGFSQILDARERSRPNWVHLVWTHNVFALAVVTWWFNFSLEPVRAWSFLHYATLVGYTVLIYVLAGLLFPTQGPEVIDFRAHFERNRKWFFVVLAAFAPVDVLNSLLDQAGGVYGELDHVHLLFIAGSCVGALIGAWTRSAVYHGLFGIAWLALLLLLVGMRYAWIPGAG